MKNINKLFVMVLVLAALMVLAPACKQADIDPVEQDDVQFVSVNSVVTARYDGFADVTTTFVFRVKASAPTRLEGEVNLFNRTREVGADVPNTNSQWTQVTITVTTGPDFGTYTISGQVTMLSIGKVAVIPTSQFTVQ